MWLDGPNGGTVGFPYLWKPRLQWLTLIPALTRFGAAGSGNPSRAKQKGARDRLSAAFLTALADTFEEANDRGGSKGLDALKKVRDEDPAT